MKYNHICIPSDRFYEKYAINFVKTVTKYYKDVTPLHIELFTNDNFEFNDFKVMNFKDHKTSVTYITKQYIDEHKIPLNFNQEYLLDDKTIETLKKLNVDISLDKCRKGVHYCGLFTSKEDKVFLCDSDVLVSGNISEIFNIDMKNNLLSTANKYFYYKFFENKQEFNKRLESGLEYSSFAESMGLFNLKLLRQERILEKISNECKIILNEPKYFFNGYKKYIGSMRALLVAINNNFKDRIMELDNSWAFDAEMLNDFNKIMNSKLFEFFKTTPPKLYHFSSKHGDFLEDKKLVDSSNKYVKSDFYNLVLNNILYGHKNT
jgi:hypothetical protein